VRIGNVDRAAGDVADRCHGRAGDRATADAGCAQAALFACAISRRSSLVLVFWLSPPMPAQTLDREPAGRTWPGRNPWPLTTMGATLWEMFAFLETLRRFHLPTPYLRPREISKSVGLDGVGAMGVVPSLEAPSMLVGERCHAWRDQMVVWLKRLYSATLQLRVLLMLPSFPFFRLGCHWLKL
jgi:hypothetical protein